jgi:hypothetical protein
MDVKPAGTESAGKPERFDGAVMNGTWQSTNDVGDLLR